jgi:energy-coupling factor transporter ATP-binding protein EcfA2
MSDQNYQLRISRLPDQDISLKRINIFLGTNGTGKSKLLQEIKTKSENFGNKPVIYVEGGRTIKIIDTLQLDRNTFTPFAVTSSAKTTHKSKHADSLADRVRDALLLIDKLGQDVELNHSRAVVEWQKNGEQGLSPRREIRPLDRLFELFSEIFPSISLKYDADSKVLACVKGGVEYPPSQLSDGEKQVFSLLADIVVLGEDGRLIIADEPELNLNPGLADRLWDLIEDELSESVFVYGTHSVGFAMRTNVEKIFVLSNENSNIAEVKNVTEIDHKELPALLGSIPAILASNRALAIEGRENSIDSIIYRWLLGTNDIEIVPVGGSTEVIAVTNKTGVWDALAPNVKISGIIDCDFKSEEQIASMSGSQIVILDYHEIESYLCHPKIVHQLANSIGTVENIPSEEEVKSKILEQFEKDLVQIAAKRV